METRIGNVSNYYGGVFVKVQNGKYYWAVENYDGIAKDAWEEIPKSLYNQLIKFQNSKPQTICIK